MKKLFLFFTFLFVCICVSAQVETEAEVEESTLQKRIKQKKRAKRQYENAISDTTFLDTLLLNNLAKKQTIANLVTVKSKILPIHPSYKNFGKPKVYSLQMVEESIKQSTKTQFSLAAFFGPGSYIIPDDKISKAKAYFSPYIDTIALFSNKYFEIPRNITIVIMGFSDGSKISKNSELYNDIVHFKKVKSATNEQLNVWLSELRASELSKLFETLIKQKAKLFNGLTKIKFENVEIGKGEQLPDPTISNYKTIDERRRIVTIYWSVVPN